MLLKLYSYATVNVAYLTIITYIISSFQDDDLYLMKKEIKLRFALSLGQLPVHKFFLIPARSKSNYAKYLPKYIFYPLVMICNFAILAFTYMLYESIEYQYTRSTFKSFIGFIRFISDVVVFLTWITIFIARMLSYTFGTINSWFKLAWSN